MFDRGVSQVVTISHEYTYKLHASTHTLWYWAHFDISIVCTLLYMPHTHGLPYKHPHPRFCPWALTQHPPGERGGVDVSLKTTSLRFRYPTESP